MSEEQTPYLTREDLGKINADDREEKLKPCPFCGSDEAWSWPYDTDPMKDGSPSDFRFTVRCRICGMGNDEYETDSAAVRAWNRRADNED